MLLPPVYLAHTFCMGIIIGGAIDPVADTHDKMVCILPFSAADKEGIHMSLTQFHNYLVRLENNRCSCFVTIKDLD